MMDNVEDSKQNHSVENTPKKSEAVVENHGRVLIQIFELN